MFKRVDDSITRCLCENLCVFLVLLFLFQLVINFSSLQSTCLQTSIDLINEQLKSLTVTENYCATIIVVECIAQNGLQQHAAPGVTLANHPALSLVCSCSLISAGIWKKAQACVIGALGNIDHGVYKLFSNLIQHEHEIGPRNMDVSTWPFSSPLFHSKWSNTYKKFLAILL